MVKLIVVIEEMNMPHGTEMLAALVIEEAVRRGWAVGLFTARYNPKKSIWKLFLRAKGVRVYYPRFWFLTRYHLPHRVMVRWLWREVSHCAPDIIWSPENAMMTSLSLSMLPRTSPPFLVHDPSEASSRYPHYPQLWFQVCNRVTGLSVHGDRQAQSARNYYNLDRPIQRIYPASYPPCRSLSAPLSKEGPLRFGQFGRIHHQKGVPFSVGAMKRLVAAGLDVELHLFGAGPETGEIRALVSSLGLTERVFFHGRYNWRDMDTLVEKVDVGLMPSIFEGFGLVMLELMSRGRPVIATDVGSSREVLEGLGGGWVVRRADTEDLAQAMIRCCQHPEMILKAGDVARKVWQKNFTPKHMFERYLDFWRSCGASV